jgi:YVTN family beta-propeller protein
MIASRITAICILSLTALCAQGQTVSTLTVTPSPAFTLIGGPPLQFHAIAKYSDGTSQDVTAQTTWTVDTPTVATIDTAGVASGIAVGVAQITATFGGKSISAPLTTENVSPGLPTAIATVPVGMQPVAVAVNPATGKVYVANSGSANVTVFDPATQTSTAVSVGQTPSGIAVNSITNRIYVANSGTNDVTVIDGANDTTSTVSAGTGPLAIAVNPVTNRIYVANTDSYTVIDGQSNISATYPVGTAIISIAINPLTDRIYLGAQTTPANVLVFDGATNSQLATVPVPAQALSLAVNTTANQIYPNSPMNGVPFVILDGASNTVSRPAIAPGAQSIAVNPLQNKVILGAPTAGIYDPVQGTSFTVISSANIRGYTAAAVNTVTTQAYLVSERTNTVGVLDGTNGYAMTTSIPVGMNPVALAVDPVRNKVYVVGKDDNSLTVIDGASNTPAPLVTGARPDSVAVNPLTNKIYVANLSDSTVTVVDGVTGAASTVHVGTSPVAVDVDPVANKIYTANSGSGDVTVIDGATNQTTSVRAGTNPIGLIVNPQTGRVYVASSGDNTITVIDNAAGTTSTLLVGAFPVNPAFFRMAVNQVTNRIYVPIFGTGMVTAIDGATNGTNNIMVGGGPFALAVNPATNRVYVANGTSSLAVIDSNTNSVTAIPIGFNFFDVAANPITNRIYAFGAQSSGSIAVVDGDTAQVTTVPVPTSAATTVLAIDTVANKIYAGSLNAAGSTGVISLDGKTNAPILTGVSSQTRISRATALAVNPATNSVYAVSIQGASGAVIGEENTIGGYAHVTILPLSGNRTTSLTPTFTLGFGPSPMLQNIYYRFDTREGPWTVAAGTPNSGFSAMPAEPLQPGLHVLLAYASLDNAAGPAGTGAGIGDSQSPVTGVVSSYAFFVVPALSVPVVTSLTVTETISAVANVGWVAQFTLTNRGNVNVTNVTVTNARLNGISSQAPVPPINGSILPGQSVNISVAFPAAAATSGSRGSLQLQGTYQAVLPSSSSQPGSFSLSQRIVLP